MKPEGPVAHRSDYVVVPDTHAHVAALVRILHYSKGTANTSVHAHSMIRKSDGVVVGGALWMPPTRVAAESVTPAGADWRGVLNLSRLVVAPDEPKNAAGILLSGSLRLVAEDERWHTAVTWADTGQGHKGTIYKATNWVEVGEGTPKAVWGDKDGKMVAIKQASRTRTAAEMRALGYEVLYTSRKIKFAFDLRRLRS